jgi:hypothetical protein
MRRVALVQDATDLAQATAARVKAVWPRRISRSLE